MKKKWTRILWLTLLATLPCPLPASAQDTGVAVVVNQSNRLNNMPLAELRKVFAAERRSWAVGVPIKLIVRAAGTSEHTAVLKVLGMSEHEYKQYWIAEIFRGEVESEPLSLPSVEMQVKALAIFPGAITLVNLKDVRSGMKVVKIDDHLPGEPGYPLP